MAENLYTEENSKYLKNNPTWHIEDSAWKANHILKILKRNKIEPQTIVDVGCGAGAILGSMQKKMPEDVEFTGYDISGHALKMAENFKNEHLIFVQEDFLQTKINYDLLLMIDVFEHVDDYLGFLKACKGRAKNTVFHIPLDISVQSVIRKRFVYERQTVGHLHYFTKETALETLKDSGYEILDYFYTAATIDLPVKTWKSRMAVFPRKFLAGINKNFAAKWMGGFSIMVLTK